MPEPPGGGWGLCAPAGAARRRLSAASGRIANFIGWPRCDRCDASTSLPENRLLRRYIRLPALGVAEVSPPLPSCVPGVQLIERQADLDQEIIVEQAGNDLSRCYGKGGDDSSLDPPEPLDLVRRWLDDDVLDDPEHARSSHGAASAVSTDAAKKLSVPSWVAPSCFRLRFVKANLRALDDEASLFRTVGVRMNNAKPPVYPEGDQVGVVEVYRPHVGGPAFPPDMVRDALLAISGAHLRRAPLQDLASDFSTLRFADLRAARCRSQAPQQYAAGR
jgi:hypothetical protein